jgi:hypothetical protein
LAERRSKVVLVFDPSSAELSHCDFSAICGTMRHFAHGFVKHHFYAPCFSARL